MFKKMDSKKLSIVFLVLLVIVLIVTMVDRKKGDRTMIDNLVEIDTADIMKIKILSHSAAGNIVLERIDDAWKVNRDGKLLGTDKAKVRGILEMLTKMKPSSRVAVGKDKFQEYQVTDSAGTRLEVYNKKKKMADLIIGKMDYKPKPSQYGNYGGNQAMGDFKTFVRPNKEKDIYTVDEFLAMTFSTDLSAYRNHSVLKTGSSDIMKITFDYPADSSFVLDFTNGRWNVGGMPADSSSVADYLRSLSSVSGYSFADDDIAGDVRYKITIEGDNIVNPIVVSVFENNEGKKILNSSMNKEASFIADENGLFNRIFIGKNKLLGSSGNN